MTSRAFLALALATGPLISGCLHASAKTIVDSPPLEMPAPPPRVIETVEVTPPAPLPLPEEPPRQPVSPPVAAVPPARPAPRAEAPARSEPPPKVEPPAEPRAADEVPRPAPTLQTTPAVAEVEVARGNSRHHRPRGRRLEAGQLRGAQRRRPDAVRHGEAVHRPGGRRVDQAKSRAGAEPRRQGAGRGGSARATLIPSRPDRRPGARDRSPPQPRRERPETARMSTSCACPKTKAQYVVFTRLTNRDLGSY